MVKVGANVVNQGAWYKLQPSVMREKGLETHFIASCSRCTKRSLHEIQVFCDRSTKCNQHSSINSKYSALPYHHALHAPSHSQVYGTSTAIINVLLQAQLLPDTLEEKVMRTAVALVTCWVSSFFFVG